MKIVIDIPNKMRESLEQGSFGAKYNMYDLVGCVMNGTPLPKGHGRLIDESDLMPDSDYEDGIFYAVSVGMIGNAPTIIEADTEGSESE